MLGLKSKAVNSEAQLQQKQQSDVDYAFSQHLTTVHSSESQRMLSLTESHEEDST